MYYLFYLKKLKDEEPHARTIWFLGIFFSYWVFCAIDLFLLFFFLYSISLEFALAICFLGVLLFYWIYSKNGRGKFVVEERKLLIRGSFCLSVIWAILFFVITVTMFLSLAFMRMMNYIKIVGRERLNRVRFLPVGLSVRNPIGIQYRDVY